MLYFHTNSNAISLTSGIFIYLLIMIIGIIKTTHMPAKKRLSLGALMISIFFIVDITLFPFPANIAAIRAIRVAYPFETHRHINLQLLKYFQLFPLSNLSRFSHHYLNILLFIPFGASLRLYFDKKSWLEISAISFGMSLIIECTQLLCSILMGATFRIFDINDLLFNSIGGIVGALMMVYVLHLWHLYQAKHTIQKES